MSLPLSEHDKLTIRTALYGAVSLPAVAGAVGGTPHRITALQRRSRRVRRHDSATTAP
jgi:hypothetical protein